MKRLVLVRHGKSSWKHNLPDHDRPLKKRGYRDGELITNFFEDMFQPPALFWSSSAMRASETAKMFRKHFEIPKESFEIKEELYTFEASQLLKIIKSCDDSVDQLFVFGHNPAITNLVNRLGDKEFENIPTTGLCVLDFEVENWNDLKDGKVILYLFPKNLR